MKETEIILIRHGETEWNSQKRMQGHSNSDLSSVGQAQIQALGQWMKNVLSTLYTPAIPRVQNKLRRLSLSFQDMSFNLINVSARKILAFLKD